MVSFVRHPRISAFCMLAFASALLCCCVAGQAFAAAPEGSDSQGGAGNATGAVIADAADGVGSVGNSGATAAVSAPADHATPPSTDGAVADGTAPGAATTAPETADTDGSKASDAPDAAVSVGGEGASTTPADPAAPTTPADPAAPTTPTTPTDPADPADPANPADPAQATDAASSATAATSATPVSQTPSATAAAAVATPAGAVQAAATTQYLLVGKDVFFNGTARDWTVGNASYLVSTNTLTLGSGTWSTIVARGLGGSFIIYLKSASGSNITAGSGVDDYAIRVGDTTDDSLTIGGIKGSNLVMVGRIGISGDLAIKTDGGITLVNMAERPGVVVDGNLAVSKGTNQFMSINEDGVRVAGGTTISGGDNLFMGLFGSGLLCDGVVNISGGTNQFLGLMESNSSGKPTKAIYGLYAGNGLNVSGGTNQAVAVGLMGDDAAVYVDSGDAVISSGMLQAVGPLTSGLVVAHGNLRVKGGTLDALGAYIGASAVADGAPGAGNIYITGGVVNAFATGKVDTSSIDWQKITKEWKSAKTLQDYLDILGEISFLNSHNKKGYALTAAKRIDIANGTVNAFAFDTATGGTNNEFIGIHAGTSITIIGGIVVALADIKASDSTAIGMHAGTTDASGGYTQAGTITITGGTTTAYGFNNAKNSMALYVGSTPTEAGVIAIAPKQKIAAGKRAPGTQVAAFDAGDMASHPYIYVTDGRLYLTDEYIKWDDLGQDVVYLIVGFDPADGHLKMTREMMQSLVGLNRMTIILSDGVDLVGDSWSSSLATGTMKSMAASYAKYGTTDNATIYLSSLFKGQGVVFVFETGQMVYKKTTIHQVDGVDVYDFGTRYDTDPEHAVFYGMVGDRLIHSVHFNYQPGEWPADMSILMFVGDSYAGQTVSWYYLDPATGQLVWIADGEVDPFGWVEFTGQKVLPAHETALLKPASTQPANAAQPANAQPVKAATQSSALPPTGDSAWLIVALVLCLAAGALIAIRSASKGREV